MKNTSKKYAVALPKKAGSKGFCHPTILVSAINEKEAIEKVYRIKGKVNIGDIKEVNY